MQQQTNLTIMNEEIAVQVCKIARFCGRHVTWTQGAGGNVSFILHDTLWVKRSGLRLRDMQSSSDFFALPRAFVRDLLFSPNADAQLAQLAPAASVESFFHALLGPITVHTHLVGSWIVADPDVRFEISPLSSSLGVWVARVPYAAPGAALGRAVATALPSCVPESGVVLLQNHGVIVWGQDVDSVLSLLTHLDTEICRQLGIHDERIFPFVAIEPFSPAGTTLCVHPEYAGLCHDALLSPLTPDAALHMGFGPDAGEHEIPALGRLTWQQETELRYVCASKEILENAVEIFAAQCIAWFWARRNLSRLSNNDVQALLRWGAGKYGGVLNR